MVAALGRIFGPIHAVADVALALAVGALKVPVLGLYVKELLVEVAAPETPAAAATSAGPGWRSPRATPRG